MVNWPAMIYTVQLLNEILINIPKLLVLFNNVLYYTKCPIYCYVLTTPTFLAIHNRKAVFRKLVELSQVSQMQKN